ncbi:hypothetical protein ILUMI_18954 [Ignelater luminosus]|uniref:J domain-containing protein n=1 Tax=Ignelater luminosus TaxID=2038154 RepID=A0A8K0G5X1_IGNLU|nr:hypothetical protein ILUMI_18954 [Ignelater luminosus]
MDVNKDEAERCIEIAEKFIKGRNKEKAEKFLRKAERLFPSRRAKNLLTRVRLMSPAAKAEKEPPKRKEPPKTKMPSTSQGTREQYETVKKVSNCKDYYEILGVNKDATDSDIRKAYKKLALHLHPDKNKCAGAVEAFKTIGNAMAVLTDSEKRRQYDKVHFDKGAVLSSREHQRTYTCSYTRNYKAETSTEDFLNMCFGSNNDNPNIFVKRNGRVYRPNINNEEIRNNQREQQQNGFTAFFQILPILLAILLSMASSFFISDPAYSLQQTAKYTVLRETENLRLQYYVKESFNTEHQAAVRRLEAAIEEEYLTSLRHACYREKHYRDSMMWKARGFGDRQMFQQAQEISTPSCEKLQNLSRRVV